LKIQDFKSNIENYQNSDDLKKLIQLIDMFIEENHDLLVYGKEKKEEKVE
jgi:hypothetical protein